MQAVPARVLRTIRVHRMIPAGGRVVAAVSGGSDSVALAVIIRELEGDVRCELAAVAHLNHGLREAAEDDERFCAALAAQLGVPFFVERVRIAELARAQRRSIEDAARIARYAFLERVRIEAAADVIATGHTRDDQAETFLLRLLRGSGTRGLAGILPVSGRIVRPLIDMRREELRRYLTEREQPYREDETNRDVRIPRNRIRHELLPYIEREFSPGITEILAREAALARLDDERLQNEAIDSAGLIVLTTSSGDTVPLTRTSLEEAGRRWGPARVSACGASEALERSPSEALEGSGRTPPPSVEKVEIDAAGLAALHPALASRLARIALSILAPDRFVGFDHVEAVLALAAASSGSVSLPGQQAIRRASRVELVRDQFRPFANSFSVRLSIPGEVVLGAQGWIISAAHADELGQGEAEGMPNGAFSTAVQASQVVPPLVVRSRREGDRVKPRGMGGRSKKLQDFLIDRKIAREERDFLPLVVDGRGRIVWVVGHPAAEDFRVTEPSQGVIFLKARRLGGQG